MSAAIIEEIGWLRRRLADLEAQLDQPARIHHFDGATYDHQQDGVRLSRQFERVRDLMLDGQWRTLREIATVLDLPEASVSARLRDLRKPEFGGYGVDNQRVSGGLWRYRIIDLRVEQVRQDVSPSPVVSDEPVWDQGSLGAVGEQPASGSSETTGPRCALFDEDDWQAA